MDSFTEFFEVQSVPHNYWFEFWKKHPRQNRSILTLVSHGLSSNSAPIQIPRFVRLNRNCRRVGIKKCDYFSKILSCVLMDLYRKVVQTTGMVPSFFHLVVSVLIGVCERVHSHPNMNPHDFARRFSAANHENPSNLSTSASNSTFQVVKML